MFSGYGPVICKWCKSYKRFPRVMFEVNIFTVVSDLETSCPYETCPWVARPAHRCYTHVWCRLLKQPGCTKPPNLYNRYWHVWIDWQLVGQNKVSYWFTAWMDMANPMFAKFSNGEMREVFHFHKRCSHVGTLTRGQIYIIYVTCCK